jgi:intraflagellar transport protein 56
MGMYTEAQEAANKGAQCPLKNRLLFHFAHKLGNEEAVIQYHGKLEEILENQLSLASMHYLRQDFQSSIDIYKRILLDNRLKLSYKIYNFSFNFF